MAMANHKCPVGGCKESIDARAFMCQRHYLAIPFALREHLKSARKRMLESMAPAAATDYRNLRSAALEVVEQLETET